jgi:hypothetical protein
MVKVIYTTGELSAITYLRRFLSGWLNTFGRTTEWQFCHTGEVRETLELGEYLAALGCRSNVRIPLVHGFCYGA